jgi:MinD-like ATPase involved in chromosome partitioning or flagellar assembly
MALIAVVSAKGSPGCTTVALGLAAVAGPGLRPVVVECDPAGGDLQRRHLLRARPGLVDLAAAARGAGGDVFEAATQLVSLRGHEVAVVVAPAGGAQTRAALPESRGGAALSAAGRLVVADCGRLDAGAVTWPLLARADAVVLLTPGRADALAHVRVLLGDLLDAEPGRLLVQLTPGGTYPVGEVADALGRFVAEELAHDPALLTVRAALPHDRRGAAVLGGDLIAGRGWRRLPLLAALTRLLSDLPAGNPVAAVTP